MPGWGRLRSAGAASVSLLALPAVLLAAIVVVAVVDGRHANVLGLLGVVPLVAATVASRRAVVTYGVVSLLIAGTLGVYDDAYGAHQVVAQVERLATDLVAAAIAVVATDARTRREEHLRSTRRVAETVQQVLLPPPPARVGRLKVASAYRAAAASARVGGDFFDVRPGPGEAVRVLIGDVRGKGLEAVRLAGVVLAAFRERTEERPDIAALLQDLNRAVVREATNEEEFVTALIAQVSSDGCMTAVFAGHPPPLVVRGSSARLLAVADPGLPLGVRPQIRLVRATEGQLVRGDRFLFYTDGTTEARGADGTMFPAGDYAASILGRGPLDAALKRFDDAIRIWSGGRMLDDSALLAVELAGQSAPPA